MRLNARLIVIELGLLFVVMSMFHLAFTLSEIKDAVVRMQKVLETSKP